MLKATVGFSCIPKQAKRRWKNARGRGMGRRRVGRGRMGRGRMV